VIRLVFGCGYLGLRAAKRWVRSGDDVFAVTRNPQRADDLRALDIIPIVADVTQPDSLTGLPTADTVLAAIGMDRTAYSDIRMVYVDGLRNVIQNLPSETGQLMYVSSTGVYGDFGGTWIDENSPTHPTREGGKACLEAEALIATSRFADRATILRFAGIYGPCRVPTRELIVSKQWKKLSSDGYLNLIQVDDGAQIVETISNRPPTGETFLVSDGNPPLRRDYYEFIAQHFGVSQIPWEQSDVDLKNVRGGSNKRILNKKLVERFEITFEFPNYQTGLAHALDTVT
jgi:nucleoside-diphosphate-sugar epimerase